MQTLDEVKLKFKVINAYPGNIKLVEKTTQFFEKNFDGFESEVIEEIKPLLQRFGKLGNAQKMGVYALR